MEGQILNSFLGIEFGASTEYAKEKLLTRDGCLFDDENSNNDVLFFTGLSFAGRQTTFVMLLFVNDRFCKSSVFIRPKLEAYLLDMYSEIKSELNQKYFITDSDFEIYEHPYEKDDGYTETGISTGKIRFSCYWKFTDSKGGQDDFIAIKISEDMEVVINYEDGDLAEELSNQIKARRSEDY